MLKYWKIREEVIQEKDPIDTIQNLEKLLSIKSMISGLISSHIIINFWLMPNVVTPFMRSVGR
jgi:hypothetical protein